MLKICLSLILFINLSCKDKIETCSQSILDDKESLEIEYKNINYKNPDTSKFKNKLSVYIEKHNDVKCKIGEQEFHPHNEIKKILNELNSSQVSIKIVYGDDNRVQALNHPDPIVQDLSKSILAQISNSNIDNKGELTEKTLSERLNLCPGEKFENEISAAECTGFLIDDDHVMTAGHCIRSQNDCDSFEWVFDYHSDSSAIELENLYSCESIISREEDSLTGIDFAVIKLNRKVKDRKVLKFRLNGNIEKNTNLFVLGHPSGIPMKYADDATVKKNISKDFFTTNLDTFGGNSGSPVFNKDTGVVEGILVRGDEDYINSGSCLVVNTVSQSGDGEEVLRMSATKGIDQYALKSSTETNNSFKDKKYVEVEGFPLSLNIQKGFRYNFYGRKFLDVCIYHISERYDDHSWIDSSSTNCSVGEFNKIHNKFSETITF